MIMRDNERRGEKTSPQSLREGAAWCRFHCGTDITPGGGRYAKDFFLVRLSSLTIPSGVGIEKRPHRIPCLRVCSNLRFRRRPHDQG
jgi:hypothetical protein